jgi:hypothetical protein
MKKKSKESQSEARQKKAFPFLDKPVSQRLQKAGSIDLRNNFKIDEKNGYWYISPRTSDPKENFK